MRYIQTTKLDNSVASGTAAERTIGETSLQPFLDVFRIHLRRFACQSTQGSSANLWFWMV